MVVYVLFSGTCISFVQGFSGWVGIEGLGFMEKRIFLLRISGHDHFKIKTKTAGRSGKTA
jgi:hypothetical protein